MIISQEKDLRNENGGRPQSTTQRMGIIFRDGRLLVCAASCRWGCTEGRNQPEGIITEARREFSCSSNRPVIEVIKLCQELLLERGCSVGSRENVMGSMFFFFPRMEDLVFERDHTGSNSTFLKGCDISSPFT